MVSFSQRLQKPVGLMSLATRVGLVAEDRLASGALPSPTHPGSLSPGSQAESCAGRASTAMGPPWSGWSMRQRQLAVRLRDCWCPVCPCRAVTVLGEAWPLSWGQDGTSDSSHPHSPSPSSASDCGLWLLAAPRAGRLCIEPTPLLKVS